jgi:hypothetical protein
LLTGAGVRCPVGRVGYSSRSREPQEESLADTRCDYDCGCCAHSSAFTGTLREHSIWFREHSTWFREHSTWIREHSMWCRELSKEEESLADKRCDNDFWCRSILRLSQVHSKRV